MCDHVCITVRSCLHHWDLQTDTVDKWWLTWQISSEPAACWAASCASCEWKQLDLLTALKEEQKLSFIYVRSTVHSTVEFISAFFFCFFCLFVRKRRGMTDRDSCTHSQACMLKRSEWLYTGTPVHDNVCVTHAELAIIMITAKPKTITLSAEQTGRLTEW